MVWPNCCPIQRQILTNEAFPYQMAVAASYNNNGIL